MTDTKPVYVDPRTAASITGISVHTLNSWRSRGTNGPPFYKLSATKVVYKMTDLEAFMEQYRRVPAAIQLAAQA